jgi:hypothetical protein
MQSPNDDVQECGYAFGGQLVVEKIELKKSIQIDQRSTHIKAGFV